MIEMTYEEHRAMHQERAARRAKKEAERRRVEALPPHLPDPVPGPRHEPLRCIECRGPDVLARDQVCRRCIDAWVARERRWDQFRGPGISRPWPPPYIGPWTFMEPGA